MWEKSLYFFKAEGMFKAIRSIKGIGSGSGDIPFFVRLVAKDFDMVIFSFGNYLHLNKIFIFYLIDFTDGYLDIGIIGGPIFFIEARFWTGRWFRFLYFDFLHQVFPHRCFFGRRTSHGHWYKKDKYRIVKASQIIHVKPIIAKKITFKK